MQKIRHVWFIILSLFFLILGQIVFWSTWDISAESPNFSISAFKSQIDIEANGDVMFQDIYEYNIETMNGALITVDAHTNELTDYRVGVIKNDSKEIEYLTEAQDESSGTYIVTHDDSLVTFKIFYPSFDTRVQFVIEYTLKELIVNYSDTALFERRIVPFGIPYQLDVESIINLPGRVTNDDDFLAWAYGVPQGEIWPKTTDTRSYIEVSASNVPGETAITVRSLFPTYLTPNNTNIIDKKMKQEIIERENAQVEEDRKAYKVEQNKIQSIVIVAHLLSILLPILGVIRYVRLKKMANPHPVQVPEHIYTLPEDITPAVMATSVIRKEANANDFSATILDLARKGYIHVSEIKNEERGFFRRGDKTTLLITKVKNDQKLSLSQLATHEKAVLDYITPADKGITLNELEEWMRTDKAFRKTQYNFWNKFKRSAEVQGERLRGVPPKGAISVPSQIILTAIFLLILNFIIIVMYSRALDSPTLFRIIIVGIIGLSVSLASLVWVIYRPIITSNQERRQKEWQGFAKMLDDIGNMNMREVASLPLWEEYLVYAVSFGKAEKVLKAMSKQYAIEELEQLHLPINFYTNAYYINHMLTTPINQNITQSQPPSSTYSGTNIGGQGGGFSGGGGGSAGGGGGSAGGF